MSPRFSLSKDDLWKTTRGLLVVMAGAGLTYAAEWVSGTNFGIYGPVIVPIAGSLIELARRYLSDTGK